MTVIAMGLGYAISIGDPTTLSANLQVVSAGLQISGTTATFLASLATLTMAAAVLSAGALGDLYGMRRMYLVGLCGAIAFSVLAAAAPIPAVLMIARAGVGVTLAFLIGLSLAITNAVFPPGRRSAAIAAYFGVGYAVAPLCPRSAACWHTQSVGAHAFSRCRSSPRLAWPSRGGTCPKRCAPLVGWIWLAWRCLPSRCWA